MVWSPSDMTAIQVNSNLCVALHDLTLGAAQECMSFQLWKFFSWATTSAPLWQACRLALSSQGWMPAKIGCQHSLLQPCAVSASSHWAVTGEQEEYSTSSSHLELIRCPS